MESPFIKNILDAFSDFDENELEGDSKIMYLTFDSLEHKDWKISDFVILCEQAPVILLDHVRQISVNNKDLIFKFRNLIGKKII